VKASKQYRQRNQAPRTRGPPSKQCPPSGATARHQSPARPTGPYRNLSRLFRRTDEPWRRPRCCPRRGACRVPTATARTGSGRRRACSCAQRRRWRGGGAPRVPRSRSCVRSRGPTRGSPCSRPRWRSRLRSSRCSSSFGSHATSSATPSGPSSPSSSSSSSALVRALPTLSVFSLSGLNVVRFSMVLLLSSSWLLDFGPQAPICCVP
jgi:hypothetical protein